MKKSGFVLFIVLSLLLSSCAAAKNVISSEAQDSGYFMEAPAAPMPASEMVSMEMDKEALSRQSLSDESAADRIVIKNANLTIVVEDPAAAMEQIGSMAEKLGGFVVSSNLYKVTKEAGIEVPEVNLTIRVPAETLDQTLVDIKALVADPEEDVLSENISGQDVTREYTDLESRLRNLENTEKQLQAIMDQAKTTEEVMSV